MINNKSIKTFVNNLHSIKNSPDTTLRLVSDELVNFAEELKLGFMEITTEFHSPTLDEKDSKVKVVLYKNPQGYNEQPLSKQFLSTNMGNIKFTACPSLNSTWTEEEISDIVFIFQTIYILTERSQFFSSMISYQETDFYTGAKNLQGLHTIGDLLFEHNELSLYTVIFLNIKNLRFYNLLHGEKNVNYMLRVYTMMTINFLKDKGFFAHLGGDNFVTLIKSENLPEYFKFTSNILIPVDSNGIMQNVSIATRAGVYDIQPGVPFSIALSNASFALGMSKKSMQNDTVLFDQDLNEKLFEAKKISSSFLNALDNNEISVFYQPKIDLTTKKIFGAEALSRWQKEKLLLPEEFLPHLETEGLTYKLDLFVLNKICVDIKTWIKKGIPIVPISFNISQFDFYYDNLESDIIEIINLHNIKPSFIEIEIPELRDSKLYPRLERFINTMSKFGVKICLDQFGTKTASLSMLSSFHFDTLKINREVVNQLLLKNKVNLIFTKALLAITKELNIKVIAQGIETSEHLSHLKKIGCKFGQGFYFEKPLYQIEFENLLLQEKNYY